MLKNLLNHGALSLYSLNAPQDSLKGATPLSFASWLNLPDVVRLLLEEHPGVVTVDGMDSRGATPLMCQWDPAFSRAFQQGIDAWRVYLL